MKKTAHVARVLSYQNINVVKKYSQEQGLEIDIALEHFEECKKFLYVASIAHESVSPSRILDNMWHTFILFTRDYHEFCHNYLGKFVHHQPGTGSGKSKEYYIQAFEYGKMLAGITFDNLAEEVWSLNYEKQAKTL